MSLYIKLRKYFTIKQITRGLLIAISSSMAIYLDYLFNIVNPFINTISGLLALYYLIKSESKVGLEWFYRDILVLVDKFKL